MFCFRRPLFGSLLLVAAAALACGGESLTIPPTTGTLQVTTSTSGAEPDPDGYVVQVDGGTEQLIGASASIQNEAVEPGTHAVQLAGLAPNCTVGGENPRIVSITAGETETVAFEVTCGATTGGLQVSSSTSGPSPDADGYSVTVDGIDRGVLPATGTLAVDALSPGDHLVGLSGVAGNCQVQGDNPRTAAVTNGAIATVAFTITCTTPPANVGSIRIATATTGADPDANGYSFALDGGPTQPIAINTATILSQIGVGLHSVSLSGVAANCTVQGTNPRAVTVAAGATADVSFAISCSGTTGAIRVNVTTSGSPTDPDGYRVTLDDTPPGSGRSMPVPTTGSITFTGVQGGTHSVGLSGLAGNCSVAGGPSQNVSVTVGATAEVSFTVTCAATTGSIKVTTATTGPSPDNAYSVNVDGGLTRDIPGNGTITYNGITPGPHSVALTQIIDNCIVGGQNPRPVTVTAGQTVNVDFAVTCGVPSTARIAFVSDNPGVRDVFTVNPDGSDRMRLTDGLAGLSDSPQWSPDRSKIVFQGGPSGGEIYVINADGSGLTNLSNTPSGTENESGPKWSPNGSRILFAKTTIIPSDAGDTEATDLYAMNANGSSPVPLTTTHTEGTAGGYNWSPDGSVVAFESTPAGMLQGVYVVSASGGTATRLSGTGVASWAPSWSPDGRKIAFLSQAGAQVQVWTMNADGSAQTPLTDQTGDDKTSPSWSPDGSKIVYMYSYSVRASDIWTVNADGTGEFNVTGGANPGGGGDNTSPVWSPDGLRIAFVFGFGSGTPEVRVIAVNGSGLRTRVDGRLSSYAPDW
jgi:Tol biopolymer transport system component